MGTIASFNKNLVNQDFPQLPVHWYTSQAVYDAEVKHLFAQSPRYVGHQAMVPNHGDFRVLDWMQNAKMLVNQHGDISLLSNVCRHRQAIMLDGAGNTSHIVCPLHRWTYELNGKLLAAPKFEQNPCLHLNKTELQQWQGMLFQSPHGIIQELQQLGCQADFDFSGYHFHSAQIDHYDFNWKTFIETYLEDYHVSPFHPGLNNIVNCSDLHWEFAENYSVQHVGYRPPAHENPSPIYQRWQNEIVQFHGKNPPKQGAIWFVYYPFLMIEWYPNVLVVSHLVPTGVNSCRNVVEFYYTEEIALFEPNYIAAQQAAYYETAIEDKEICERMHNGRIALAAQGIDERGPYQHPMETGMQHFHEWYRRQMAHHLPTDHAA